MKFFALIALVGSAAALRLSHNHVNTLAHQQSKVKWEKLTKAQQKEIEDWVVEELTTGEKTITKAEAEAAIKAFGEKHGFEPLPKEAWEELERMFDAADTNNDGQLDLEEIMASCE